MPATRSSYRGPFIDPYDINESPHPDLPEWEDLVDLCIAPKGSEEHQRLIELQVQLNTPLREQQWPWDLLVSDMVYDFHRFAGRSTAARRRVGVDNWGSAFNLTQLHRFRTFWRETSEIVREDAIQTKGLGWRRFYTEERQRRATHLANLVKQCRSLIEHHSIAYRGYTRSGLEALLKHLKQHGIPFPSIDPACSSVLHSRVARVQSTALM